MKSFNITLLCLLIVLLCSGCPTQSSKRNASTGQLSVDVLQQNDDAFRDAFQFFNSLENMPVLLGLPGTTREQQTVARLDKWIANRTEDRLWKNDPMYPELEKSFRETSENIKTIIDLCKRLQSENEKDYENIDVPDLTKSFATIPEQLNRLSAESSIDFSADSEQIKLFSDRFSRVRNTREAASFARADQAKSEILGIEYLLENIEKFANTLKVQALDFQSADADHFKEVVWSRDISFWARGDKQNQLERAKLLFDWTIRNIDLRSDALLLSNGQTIEAPPQEPWQTLLLGSGTRLDRAWVFIELLRQQRIDACLLAVVKNEENSDEPNKYDVWGVGVLIDNDIYVFVPSYGVAVPGPGGIKLGKIGENDGEIEYNDIATLSQIAADEQLLKQLDFDDTPFAITSEMVKKTVALIICPPCFAAQRMSMLQKELSGDETLVLYQSFQTQSDLFSKIEHVVQVKHWLHPLRAMFERQVIPQRIDAMMIPFRMTSPENGRFPLWAGRVLYFKGKLEGADNAVVAYQEARISDRKLDEFARNPKITLTNEMVNVIQLAKRYAKYWIANTCIESGKTSSAIDHYLTAEKDSFAISGQLWGPAIAYGLGRAYEKTGQYSDAMARYMAFTKSPTRPECAVRIQWLKKLGK